MTDDQLEAELRSTLLDIADAYDPLADLPAPDVRRRSPFPWLLSSAAALVVVVGLAATLDDSEAADVDIANSTTSSPAPTAPPAIDNSALDNSALDNSALDEPVPDQPPLAPAPETADDSITPVSFADIDHSAWVLYGIERDGVRLDDEINGTITIDFVPADTGTGHSLIGWAGCPFSAEATTTGTIGWQTTPSDCENDITDYAAAFRTELSRTRHAYVADIWPTPFVYLDGDDVRILLVPMTDATVPGPAPALAADDPG